MGDINMKAFKITDIKTFMNKLLVAETFDSFNTNEISVTTFCTYHIDCHINKNYYSQEELEEMEDCIYATWSQLKPICFEIIKGKKVPYKFKITLSLPPKYYSSVLSDSSDETTVKSIDNLYLHITYENNSLTIITASSLNIFTMDKTVDNCWDDYIQKHLLGQFSYEEI
jgi:hypothetical protein